MTRSPKAHLSAHALTNRCPNAGLATTRHRQRQRQAMLQERRTQGLAVARMAAQILPEEFGVSRIVLLSFERVVAARPGP